MEALSLRERDPYTGYRHGHVRPRECRSRSPRLPTPENSLGSNEGFGLSAGANGRRINGRPTLDLLLRPSSEESKHDQRQSYIPPRSPPYHPDENYCPSLPPLRTLLGDTMTSPPNTPRAHRNSIQLLPREPSYTSSTYKPPALYPNNKPPADLALELNHPFSSASSCFETRHKASTRRPEHQLHFPLIHDDYDPSGRGSLHRRSLVSPTNLQQSPLIDRPAATAYCATHPYRSPEQTPISITFNHRSVANENHLCDGHQQLSRRSSVADGCRPYHSRSFDAGHNRNMSHQESDHARYHQHPHEHHHHLLHHHHIPTMPPSILPPGPMHPYDGGVSGPGGFLLAGNYEYQHGKARKRSNLPKHSTEIMKNWFDQNIHNPYPSEEQKAIFSSATGISMTQVSNWFINHRRRCPELREKKDKGSRGGSGSSGGDD